MDTQRRHASGGLVCKDEQTIALLSGEKIILADGRAIYGGRIVKGGNNAYPSQVSERPPAPTPTRPR